MQGKRNNVGLESEDSFQRDELLGALLRETGPAPELLSWRQIEQLVANAPAPAVPWYTRLLQSPAPLRYALAPLVVAAIGTVTLWVLPAQSEQVGTMVVTTMPSAWSTDSAALAEVQHSAQREFGTLGIGQGSLSMLSADRDGRKQLVFTMSEAHQPQAAQVITKLEAQYPALAAYTPKYIDLTADSAANRLAQLVDQVKRGAGTKQNQTELGRKVLQALSGEGLQDVDIQVRPQADGSLEVDIAATFSTTVKGHTQEELKAAGLDAATLGQKSYQQLLEQVGASAQGR
jgi:hypothetical protein